MSEYWEYEQAGAEEAYREQLLDTLGPQWAEENGFAPYDDVIRDFTAVRLQSYYLTHPDLAGPAHDSLLYAQSLMPSHSKAALVFAATAVELAVKTVLLKPIVFGLVHTEAVASFVTDLTTQHTGMERFQALLTVILAQFGGVDLKTYKRAEATKTLWDEIGLVQTARNAVVHRGEIVAESNADLAVAIAETLLQTIFPKVLEKLGLHLHEPINVCGKRHEITVNVLLWMNGAETPILDSVGLDFDDLTLATLPEAITGRLGPGISDEDVNALRSGGEVRMVASELGTYAIRVAPDSKKFAGCKVKA